jgi:DNA replication protein DnaC
MRLGDNPHITRQHRTQLLQSVAITVGVGKTHLATALGHIAVRRGVSVLMLRADAMFKRLKAARLDNSTEAEMRRLAQVQLLLIDDFALQPLDATETADFYELVVARHHRASTVTTSNREPAEWLTMMSDPLLAQSAVDRLTSTAHELVMDGTQTVLSRH